MKFDRCSLSASVFSLFTHDWHLLQGLRASLFVPHVVVIPLSATLLGRFINKQRGTPIHNRDKHCPKEKNRETMCRADQRIRKR